MYLYANKVPMNNVSAYGLLDCVNKSRESERQTARPTDRQTLRQRQTDGHTDLCVGYAIAKHVLTLRIPSIGRTLITHTHTHTHTHTYSMNHILLRTCSLFRHSTAAGSKDWIHNVTSP